MTIQYGKAVIDRDNVISAIDSRIYGGFIEHMGRCVYGGIYEPAHPEADSRGFRQDVIALVKDLHVPITRYPGGNFVSGYHWEDSVGPKESRPVRMDAAWRSVEPNLVGLHEFEHWARQIDTEIMMAVNLGTRGVDAAAQLLEYCNVKGGTALSELRKTHGHPEPYAFKVWCLGNEMDGPWQICNKSAAEYGTLARETGKVMKRIDPGIELVACGSSGVYLPTFPEWDAVVLEHCYDYVDYLSVHMYLNNKEDDLQNYLVKSVEMDRYIDAVVATCDYVKAKKRSSRRMYLSFDEWNVEPYDWKNNDAQPWIVGPPLCEGRYSMADAVVFGSMIISLIKHSDRIKIACLAQLVNVFGPVMTVQNGIAWKQSIYYPYLHASLYGRGTAVEVKKKVPAIATTDYTEASMLESVAVFDEASGQLTVFAVNRSLDDELALEVDLRGFNTMAQYEHIVLTHDQPLASNSAHALDELAPQLREAVPLHDNQLKVDLPPMSWNVLRFS